MDVLDAINPVEQYLSNMASLKWRPIAATFELLPACNMDCKMCYVRMSMKEMSKYGEIMDTDEWLKIGKQAVDEGVLFILLTGGEPLLHPNFKQIYEGLRRLGLIININTNATLINEEMADFFSKNKPRRINISLYGASDETYSKLCNNSRGFTQVKNAIELLKKRNINVKLNFCITPYNAKDVDKMVEFAEKYEIPVAPTTYMYPPNRKTKVENYEMHRLSPKQAAKEKFKLDLKEKQGEFFSYARDVLEKINELDQMRKDKEKFDLKEKPKEPLDKQEEGKSEIELDKKNEQPMGFGCRAGNSTFWINWQGKMLACGMLSGEGIDSKQLGIQKSWEILKSQVSSTKRNKKCPNCKYKNMCQVCVASCQAETGAFDKIPKYLCDMNEEYERLLIDYIKKER